MIRSHTILTAWTLALLLPTAATAGPLSWGFRAEAPDGTVLRDVSGITDAFYVDNFLADPRSHAVTDGPPPPSYGYYSTWRETSATVTITDEASGRSGDVFMWWAWVEEFDIKYDGSVEPIYEGYNSGPWAEPAVLELGGNRYAVRAPGGDLQVSVTPGAVATPEPTTLALAGLGLAAVRLRRRVSPANP